jgi:hypothetical protein
MTEEKEMNQATTEMLAMELALRQVSNLFS